MRSRSSVRLHVALQVLLATWILWVGNAWAFRHSWRIDLTRDRRYAVPEETEQFLRELPKRVDVVVPYAFGASAADRIGARVLAQAVRTITEFEQVNPYCRLAEHVHIGREPLRWQELRESRDLDQPNRVYLFAGDRREVVTIEDLADIREGRDGPVLERERVPEALSAALLRVVRDDAPIVLFSTGHGETALDDARDDVAMSGWTRDLRDRGFDLRPIDIRAEGRIPEAAAALIVVGGRVSPEGGFEAFGADEAAEVGRFLDRGGNLLLLLPFEGRTGLESLLTARGIEPLPGLVCSSRRSAADGLGAIEVREFDEAHPTTARFRPEEDALELSSFRALEVSAPATALLRSAAETWRELPPLDGVRAADEAVGPFPLAAASGEGKGRVIVAGSWTPVLDIFYRGQTRRLLLGFCDWLTGRGGLPAGVGRIDPGDRVAVTPTVARAFFWTSVVALPACSLVLGIFVWLLRRRQT